MRLNDAVHAVTGEVFRDGWSRVRGSMQGLHVAKQAQLMRAAAGHRPAVFKATSSIAGKPFFRAHSMAAREKSAWRS